jgi:hypothetical protein
MLGFIHDAAMFYSTGIALFLVGKKGYRNTKVVVIVALNLGAALHHRVGLPR